MRVKHLIVPNKNVVSLTPSMNIEEALSIFETSGYRCIPVLEDRQFKGNIYKSHLYQYIAKRQGELTDSVSHFISDLDEVIDEDTPFHAAFLKVKRLPYLAVEDKDQVFKGILTHAKVLEILEDSYGSESGSYTLSITTHDYQGALCRLTKCINKHSDIKSLLTLDSQTTLFRRIIVTLPKELDVEGYHLIIKELEKNGFRVMDVEHL